MLVPSFSRTPGIDPSSVKFVNNTSPKPRPSNNTCGGIHRKVSYNCTVYHGLHLSPAAEPYVCDFPGCGKSFAITGALTIHKRTHNGHKPFKCTYCERAFAESSNLSKHVCLFFILRTASTVDKFNYDSCVRTLGLGHTPVQNLIVASLSRGLTSFPVTWECTKKSRTINRYYHFNLQFIPTYT